MKINKPKFAHFFHSPTSLQRIESLLKIIALPKGCQVSLNYEQKWLNDELIDQSDKINKNKSFKAIIWGLSIKTVQVAGVNISTFDFAFPIRVLDHIKITKSDGVNCKFSCRVQSFVNNEDMFSLDNLRDFTKLSFGDGVLANPGEIKGYAFLSPIPIFEKREVGNYPILFDKLCKVSFSPSYQNLKTEDFPLVVLKKHNAIYQDIHGALNYIIGKTNHIEVDFYQTEKHRERQVSFLGFEGKGKFESGNAKLKVSKIGKEEKALNVSFGDTHYVIPLNVRGIKPWYSMKVTPLILLFAIAISSYWLLPLSSRPAILVAFAGIMLNRIWDSFVDKK